MRWHKWPDEKPEDFGRYLAKVSTERFTIMYFDLESLTWFCDGIKYKNSYVKWWAKIPEPPTD